MRFFGMLCVAFSGSAPQKVKDSLTPYTFDRVAHAQLAGTPNPPPDIHFQNGHDGLMFLVCGDVFYDLTGSGDPDGSDMTYDGRIGGSAMAVAVGMARLGAKTGLLGGVSTDMLGERIVWTLRREGVGTGHLIRSHRRTALGLTALDHDGQPSHGFYGNEAADRGVTEIDLPTLDPAVTGLHFGSYTLAVEPVAGAFAALALRESSRFISLDPNIRPIAERRLDVWRRRITALRRCAAMVRVSENDLALLHPGADPVETAVSWAGGAARMVVMTRGGGDVVAFRGADTIRATPPRVDVVDSPGAGDAFQAALLTSVMAQDDPRTFLRDAPAESLQDMLERAIRAARITCTRPGGNPPRLSELG